MEELLNKLIEKGWKPFGNKKIKDAKTAERNINLLDEKINYVSNFKDKVAFTNGVLIFDEINLRELVSKESGLWQFVCEYVLIDIDDIYTRDFIDEGRDYIAETYSSNTDYEYWVLRSALCDEDKLEQFLLDNIKVGND